MGYGIVEVVDGYLQSSCVPSRAVDRVTEARPKLVEFLQINLTTGRTVNRQPAPPSFLKEKVILGFGVANVNNAIAPTLPG